MKLTIYRKYIDFSHGNTPLPCIPFHSSGLPLPTSDHEDVGLRLLQSENIIALR